MSVFDRLQPTRTAGRSIFRSLNPKSSPASSAKLGRLPAAGAGTVLPLLAVLLHCSLSLLLPDESIPPRLHRWRFDKYAGVRFDRGETPRRHRPARAGEDTVKGGANLRVGIRIVLVVVAANRRSRVSALCARGRRRSGRVCRGRLFANCRPQVRNPRLARLFSPDPRQFVGEELIVRQIVIERTNHVIAIGEGIGTVGTGVSGHIHLSDALRRSPTGLEASKRSTTVANAPGNSSATEGRDFPPGVCGKPIKS